MAYHRIGDSFYSDQELRARNESLMDFLIPALVTGIGIYWLHGWLSPMAFFVLHTTVAKVIYVFTGLCLFCVGHTYRKVILAIVSLLFAIGVFVVMVAAAWQWLTA